MAIQQEDSTLWVVVTADQRNSRRSADQVPAAVQALDAAVGDRFVLGFERTAGDELQGLTRDAGAVVDAVLTLTKLPYWHLGIGIGTVEQPLPASTREARGPAYVAAREAVDAARSAPAHLRLVCAKTVAEASYGEIVTQRAARAEAALVLLRALVSRRTPEGWEIMQVLHETGSGRAAAARLGISASAVSQRATRSARSESQLGAELARALLAEALAVPA